MTSPKPPPPIRHSRLSAPARYAELRDQAAHALQMLEFIDDHPNADAVRLAELAAIRREMANLAHLVHRADVQQIDSDRETAAVARLLADTTRAFATGRPRPVGLLRQLEVDPRALAILDALTSTDPHAATDRAGTFLELVSVLHGHNLETTLAAAVAEANRRRTIPGHRQQPTPTPAMIERILDQAAAGRAHKRLHRRLRKARDAASRATVLDSFAAWYRRAAGLQRRGDPDESELALAHVWEHTARLLWLLAAAERA